MKKLDIIQRTPTQATLLKLHFTQIAAHAIVYDSLTFGGLGLRNLIIEQGIGQKMVLL